MSLDYVIALLSDAFLRAAVPNNAINGFRKCGICPLDPNIFTEEDFVAAEVSDIPLEDVVVPLSSALPQHSTVMPSTSAGPSQHPTSIPSTSTGSSKHSTSMPSTSTGPTVVPSSSADPFPHSSGKSSSREDLSQATVNLDIFTQAIQIENEQELALNTTIKGFHISPKDINPLPKQKEKTQRNVNRKRGKTAIITSSTYKAELVEDKKKKDEEMLIKKRKLFEKESKNTAKRLKKTRHKNKIQKKDKVCSSKKKSGKEDDDDDDEEYEDAECFYCNEAFSKSKDNEGWIRCFKCKEWAHEECAGCEEEDDDFECEFCK